MSAARVAIIGGGYAGLAAAVTLAEKDIPLTLFEASEEWGGRARCVSVKGLNLDNGQHILLGAYQQLLRLMQLVGAPRSNIATLPLRLIFPPRFSLKAKALPAPWNIAAGLALASGVSLRDKFRTLLFMRTLRQTRFKLDKDMSVANWLSEHCQPDDMKAFVWYPLCYAALNTPPNIASARTFLNVLAQTFKKLDDSHFLLPRSDLSSLFPTYALDFIRSRQGEVNNSSLVKTVSHSDGGFLVETAKKKQNFSHVICATAPWHVPRLIAGLGSLEDLTEELRTMGSQPIYTVYLQYPSHVRLPHPLVGMNQGITQWLFDRGQLQQYPGLLAAVVSGEGAHQSLSHADLAEVIHGEIKNLFKVPEPLWHQVIAEKRATYCCDTHFRAPNAQTAVKNFVLAGDYLEDGWPATLETAARSGIRSAELILEGI